MVCHLKYNQFNLSTIVLSDQLIDQQIFLLSHVPKLQKLKIGMNKNK